MLIRSTLIVLLLLVSQHACVLHAETLSDLAREEERLIQEERRLVGMLSGEAPQKDQNVQEPKARLSVPTQIASKQTVTARPSTAKLEIENLIVTKPASRPAHDYSQEVQALRAAQKELLAEVNKVDWDIQKEHRSYAKLDKSIGGISAKGEESLTSTIDIRTRTRLLRHHLSELSEQGRITFRQSQVAPSDPGTVRFRHAYRHIDIPAYDLQLELPVRPVRQEKNATLSYNGITVTDDMPLALSQGEKTPLRSGPRAGASRITALPSGTPVAIEKRYNDWYRVVSAQGVRGWVASKYLLFGGSYRSLPTKMVRLKGYDHGADHL